MVDLGQKGEHLFTFFILYISPETANSLSYLFYLLNESFSFALGIEVASFFVIKRYIYFEVNFRYM